MTSVAVRPDTFEMSSRETLPISFDISALLLGGEVPASPSAELVQVDTGATYSAGLIGTPSIAGNILTQTVTLLQRGKRYRLSIAFATGTPNKTWAPYLTIQCSV